MRNFADSLHIISPKRRHLSRAGWDGFFPYYAGYPEEFATTILHSAKLPAEAVVLDPWNGSGTTTYSAARMNLAAIGIDVNPAMVIVARARLLPHSEADTLRPLGSRVVREAGHTPGAIEGDPLLVWFSDRTASYLRAIEASIRGHLLGALTLTPKGARLDQMSGLAATNYVALFSIARDLTKRFRSSNPTWLRRPAASEERVDIQEDEIAIRFLSKLDSMQDALHNNKVSTLQTSGTEIRLGDVTSSILSDNRVDFVLTSPPYCTRIDYTAATRIELALLRPLTGIARRDLRQKMIGSTLIPTNKIVESTDWGKACLAFLDKVKSHRSHASSGYYYKTHIDYFSKMFLALKRVSKCLRPGGNAVLVVQDSYYKDVHNDLAVIVSEMGHAAGLLLRRRNDFFSTRSIARINSKSRAYSKPEGAVESVLCFEKVESHD